MNIPVAMTNVSHDSYILKRFDIPPVSTVCLATRDAQIAVLYRFSVTLPQNIIALKELLDAIPYGHPQ